MKLEVFDDADSAARGRFVLAVSGGHTPWIMLRALAQEDIPWAGVHVCQVDERVAPDGHPDRNLTHLRGSLLQPPAAPGHSGRPRGASGRGPATGRNHSAQDVDL